jgi:hypothetical protein
MNIKLLEDALAQASEAYFRLVLLVGEAGSGKTKVLRDFANSLHVPIINLNLELSAKLMDLTPSNRSIRISKLTDELLQHQKTSPTILDNIELLFNLELKQDPLRLLQGLSRNRIILASWNGSFRQQRLSYAAVGHPEYYSADNPDAVIVEMAS